MDLLRGFSAFPLTPADASGRVDVTALGRLLEALVAAGVDSVGLLGSTGIAAYLRRDERRRAVNAAVGVLQGRTSVIVGVGALRTDDAVDLARDAERAGADALLLAPHSYLPLTQDEAWAHYTAVAGATGLPMCVYNNPATTHFRFGDALLEKLSRVPRIAGVKMPLPADGDVAGELRRLRPRVPAGFAIGYSGDWGAADAVLAGGDAWYSSIGGVLPVSTLALCRAAQAGNAAEVRRLNALFEPLWALCREFTGLRVGYAAARAMGVDAGEAPRPILPLSRTDAARVAAALEPLSTISRMPRDGRRIQGAVDVRTSS